MNNWSPADERCAAIEERVRLRGETLGPAAYFASGFTAGALVRAGGAWRLNPVFGHLENLAAGYAYTIGDRAGRTVSTPREACGPELKALLPALGFHEVELRTMPLHLEAWWRIEAPSAIVLHTWLQQTLLAGCFYRTLWCEGANGWISFAGAMAETYASLAADRAAELRMDMRRDDVPRRFPQSPFAFAALPWPEVTAQDTIVLCDAWRAIVKR
jgi:hypothetical protein